MDYRGAPYAGFWPRVAAKLLDALVLAPLMIAMIWAIQQSIAAYIVASVLVFLLGACYPVYFHGRWGATLGKMALSLKVVDKEGGVIGYRQALYRSSVDIGFALLSVVLLFLHVQDVAPESLEGLPAMKKMAAISASQASSVVSALMQLWVLTNALFLISNARKRVVHDFIAQTAVIRLQKTEVTSQQ